MLTEAASIQDVRSARARRRHTLKLFREYRAAVDAIVMLRAFREPDTIPNRYQLIEIPSGLFKSLENAPESKIGRPDGEGSSGREEPPSAAAWRAQD